MTTRIEPMREQDNLDDLFAEARRAKVPPSDALMARVLADALETRPRAQPVATPVRPVAHRAGPWARLGSLFGGFGALAGMGTAATAGLFIGFAQPGSLAILGDAVLGTPLETVELVASVDGLLGEN